MHLYTYICSLQESELHLMLNSGQKHLFHQPPPIINSKDLFKAIFLLNVLCLLYAAISHL